MTFHSLIWSFSGFWATIYAIRASRRQRRTTLLPGGHLPEQNHFGSFGNSRTCRVSVQNFHLKVETRRFNDKHDDLAEFLANPRNERVRRALKVFYDVGAVFGVIGMIAGVGILMYTCGQFLWNASPTDAVSKEGRRHTKRGMPVEANPSSGIAINPLVSPNTYIMNLFV